MNLESISRLEHICLKSDLNLKVFGEKFELALSLPKMEYDYENETEWLEIDLKDIYYNISKPYQEGTLQEWDDTVPQDCNFGISISFHKNHPFIFDNNRIDKKIANICEILAHTFNTDVYHHRTFILGKNESRNIIFNP